MGDWHQPVILLVKALSSGDTPGYVFAYSALCKQSSVPLVGIVQIGGTWEMSKKLEDNLPWCGCLSPSNSKVIQSENISKEKMDIHSVAYNIRKQISKVIY